MLSFRMNTAQWLGFSKCFKRIRVGNSIIAKNLPLHKYEGFCPMVCGNGRCIKVVLNRHNFCGSKQRIGH